ncbi:MAG: efflux RND transporter periplasmic adaptor subunit [Psychromonas sp.]
MASNNIKKLAVMALLLGLIQGCQDETQSKVDKPLMVTTFTVQPPIETQYRDFKGTVVAADLTPLSFRLEGELNEILVRNGQHVQQGELLAKLDDRKLRQQLADTQAQYELAVKQQHRAQELLTKKMASQSEFDEISTSRRIAQVNFEVAKNKLNYSNLVAPFSGYISDVPKQSFESVNPGETILTIYRDDVVRVRINISNNVLATINPDINERNYKVRTTFSGDSKSYILNYYQHSSEPAEGENAFNFWLQMAQVKPPILQGTSANLHVDLVEAGLNIITGYVVPMTVLDAGSRENEFYIWKLIDGKVHKQSVDIIQIIKEGVIISKGLHSGDILVNSNLRRLRDKAVVATAEKEDK